MTKTDSEGGLNFMYVYILESCSNSEKFYSGMTSDIRARLKKHNEGSVNHTSKYKPWQIRAAIYFSNKARAVTFEKYLKTGSGRAFQKKNF